MIPAGVRVFVCTRPVDMRRGFRGLVAIVEAELAKDPRSGALFVFVNARRTRLKVLFYDRTGYALLYKALDRGEFRVPAADEGATATIGTEELALILEGVVLPKRPTARTIAREARDKALHAIASMSHQDA